MEDNDAQLHLKKRARRRLVGALAFVSIVAVVLPMVMDQEPRQAVQDVEIRIPGQDEKPFAPKFATVPVEKPAEKPVVVVPPESSPVLPSLSPSVSVLETSKDKAAARSVDKPADRPLPKPDKIPEKAVAKAEKIPEKAAEKPLARNDEAKRAAAILAGQSAEAKPAAKGGEFLVLIGAFSNEGNVRSLKGKLGEQGIKAFSEPLDTPQGKKIRLRAGPFPSREAAVKALEKMQKIGVSGVVAAKQ